MTQIFHYVLNAKSIKVQTRSSHSCYGTNIPLFFENRFILWVLELPGWQNMISRLKPVISLTVTCTTGITHTL